MPRRPEDVRFFLDEGLPEQVADVLRTVRYKITGALREEKRGVKDPQLIEWMGSQDIVWITKDDEARREHLSELIKHRVSTVWVRGIDRKRNTISVKNLHLMLTVKLDEVSRRVAKAKGPVLPALSQWRPAGAC